MSTTGINYVGIFDPIPGGPTPDTPGPEPTGPPIDRVDPVPDSTPSAPVTVPPRQGTIEGDAYANVMALLSRYGLESLADWAWEQIVNSATESQIIQSLREQEAYQTRFRAIFEREAQGLPPISAEEVLAYERQAVALMRTYGFPESFWDTTDDLANLIVNDISPAELEERLQGYVEAATTAPAEYRQALEANYGFGPGDLATVFADPDQAWNVLQRKWRASALAGEAQISGFGGISAAEAERLDALGVSSDQARQGFGELAVSGELFTPLDAGEQAIDRETQLGAVGGSAEAVDVIESRRRRRQAAFSGGGGFATGQSGVSGIGTSS